MNFSNKFQLNITSTTHSNLESIISYIFFLFLENKILNLKITQTQCPLKIKKFTFLKSPHIFKKSRSQFELRHTKKIVTVKNFKTLEQIQIFKKILQNITKNLPVTIKIKTKYYKLMFI